MKFGVTLPNAGYWAEPDTFVQLAVDAEAAGWDGVFVWDTPYVATADEPPYYLADAWVLLSAMAERTERVRLGTMLTPLAWHRPWLIARQAATLDRLSGGRFTLATGLGAQPDEGPWFVGDEADRRTRAAMLDESLAILEGLWSGEPFAFRGEYFSLREVTFLPRPVQRPRIPIWVVGAWPRDPAMWPRRKSMRRAIRYDGLLPNVFRADGKPVFSVATDEGLDDLRAMRGWVDQESGDGRSCDIVIERSFDKLSHSEARAEVARWEDAGATWWLEEVWREMYQESLDPGPLRRRILRGPPRG